MLGGGAGGCALELMQQGAQHVRRVVLALGLRALRRNSRRLDARLVKLLKLQIQSVLEEICP